MNSKTNKQTEKDYQDYILFSSLRITKIGLWATILLFTAAAIINTILFPDSRINKYLMQFGLILPFMILTLVAIYVKFFHKWLHFIFTLLPALTAIAIFHVGIFSDKNQAGHEYFLVWTMLTIMGTFIFYRIRFQYIIRICALIVVSFILSLIYNHTLRDKPDIFSFNLIFVIGVFLLGYFFTWYRHSLARKLFFGERELSEKNNELQKEITDRRAAEIALLESEKNYKDSLEALPDWVHVVDRSLCFVFMNKQFKEINQSLGLETNVIGKHLTKVFPFMPKQRAAEYANVFKSGELFVVEEIVTVNGIDFFTETRLIPIFKENKVAQIITVIRDIGKKKEIEALKLKSAGQKEILLREIHHRVKNNLAIVISLLDMQIRKNPNPDFIIMARDAESRIRTMSLMHEHLYKSDDLDRVPFDKYIYSLSTGITGTCSGGDIELIRNLEHVDVTIEIAMPLGLIANEIMTNACKYAFRGRKQGKITIDLKREESGAELYRLTIKDNGVGLPEGFSIEKPTSMGIYIIKLLVDQINAKMIIKNQQGTSFSIIFQGIESNKKQ